MNLEQAAKYNIGDAQERLDIHTGKNYVHPIIKTALTDAYKPNKADEEYFKDVQFLGSNNAMSQQISDCYNTAKGHRTLALVAEMAMISKAVYSASTQPNR